MPPFLYDIEFLLPVLIGIGCFGFAMRILFRDEAKAKETVEDEDEEDFEITLPRREEKLEPGRKVFYVLLFAGLGVASIIFGLAVLYPALSYAAKGIIILTIIASILVNARIDKKQQAVQSPKNGQKPNMGMGATTGAGTQTGKETKAASEVNTKKKKQPDS